MKLAIPLTFLSIIPFLGYASVPASAAEAKKPNIIFVLADDLGIDGVSCYGADSHKTPHIDALAKEGLRFETCYAAPLCGPSRCLLNSGRYAFRTGGITNSSWRAGGPGAKSADEHPIAKLMKQAGYATGQAGKWRQVGEWPSDWGFDEYITDNTAGGWYWETKYNKNGTWIDLPKGAYGPDVIQDFTFDFIRRHKDKPFFFYYAMHLVHKPTLRTPDTASGTKDINKLYDDNINYMDKQVGELMAELEKQGIRDNTLVVFSGDNGTAAGYPSPVHGRMLSGWKGTMLEGGSRVPFIASWPAVTPKGKVLSDIVSFADPYTTFAELAGAKLPEGFKTDGHSIAPQLRGEAGTQRDFAYVQLGPHWFVREPGFKMNETGALFDMSDAPFVEKLVLPADDTEQSKAARARLTAALAELNPAAGKTDRDGGNGGRKNNGRGGKGANVVRAVGPWKLGDNVPGEQAPAIANKALAISAEIDPTGTEGVIVSLGGGARGFAIYLSKGKLAFGVRENSDLTTIAATEPLGSGHFEVKATLSADGDMALLVNGKQVAQGKAPGAIGQQPRAGLWVGQTGKSAVGDYPVPDNFNGKISNVKIVASAAK
jgi:arylsulfatase A-like enzyme